MASLPAHEHDSADLELLVKVEPPQFNHKAVKEAGKLLRHKIGVDDYTAARDDVTRAFQVAHNWRNAHILPMRRMRFELSIKARRIDPAIVTAGRLKRMTSIRKKLSRLPGNLWQMQDIAGCRAIMASISDVRRVVDAYLESARHTYVGGKDYILEPKRGGYRSHHQVFEFVGLGDEEDYKHQMIEVQVRTRLQHAWATAVEAVGLVRNEDLKAGEGDADWLRFFELMASEIAAEEDCPLIPGTPEATPERHGEIRDLNKRLNALASLESYVRVIDATLGIQRSKGEIFLIQFDTANHRVSASAFANYEAGYKRYVAAERADHRIDSVLVEVDKVADLRAAYPNYYLDVAEFAERVRRLVTGATKTKKRPTISIDLTAWRNRKRRAEGR